MTFQTQGGNRALSDSVAPSMASALLPRDPKGTGSKPRPATEMGRGSTGSSQPSTAPPGPQRPVAPLCSTPQPLGPVSVEFHTNLGALQSKVVKSTPSALWCEGPCPDAYKLGAPGRLTQMPHASAYPPVKCANNSPLFNPCLSPAQTEL